MFYYMSIDKNILLGKEKVTSSNLVVGSQVNIFFFLLTSSNSNVILV